MASPLHLHSNAKYKISLMKYLLAAFIFITLLGSCSSSKLVDQYVNPDRSGFRANKVLVIGMTPEGALQKEFEYSLVLALEKQNFNAVKSVDFFGDSLSSSSRYGRELEGIKQDLIKGGFDAVLFSRITGKNTKVSLAQSYRNLSRTFEFFGDNTSKETSVYYSSELANSPIIHTETLFYCLCPGNENDLIWKGNIDISNASTSEEAIQDYVKTLVKALKKNDLLFSK